MIRMELVTIEGDPRARVPRSFFRALTQFLPSLLVVLLPACRNAFAPLGGWEAFDPPPEYQRWYDAVAECAGVPYANVKRIRWELADSLETPSGSREVLGAWEAPHTIRLRREYKYVEWVVQHEMLHDLVQTADQPVPPFGSCEFVPSPVNGAG